jgi:hypothetical protein
VRDIRKRVFYFVLKRQINSDMELNSYLIISCLLSDHPRAEWCGVRSVRNAILSNSSLFALIDGLSSTCAY